MGAYQQVSELLIERGYGAVPIMPGTKRRASSLPACGSGSPTGRNVLTVDLRRLTSGRGGRPGFRRWGSWWQRQSRPGRGRYRYGDSAIRAALGTILPTTLVRKIGNRGETMFYYGADVPESKSWYINGKCIVELIGPGRQTVLPPTIHPETGAPYYWSGSARLEDCRRMSCPRCQATSRERSRRH